MIVRILSSITIVSICLLALLLTTTNPTTAGLVGMLVIFILGYLSLLGAVTFLLFYGSYVWVYVSETFFRRPVHERLSLGRAYLYGSVIAALPMMAIGLFSTGEMKWYEFLLLFLFGVIGVFYVARRT
jgi:hypothetical protein